MTVSSFLLSVCKKYHLGRLESWAKFRLGLINEKYYLKTTKGKFVVRISIRTKQQLMFEVTLLRHIKSLPVIQLIDCGRGKYISTYKGRPCIVYKYIDGLLPNRITTTLIKQIGLFQGEFHRLGRNFRSHVQREPYTYNFSKTKVGNFNRLLQSQVPKEFVKAYKTVLATLSKVKLPRQLPTGPIHVDIKPENILTKRGKMVGVLDFDNSYIGPYVIDLGKTITWFCIKKGKLNERLLNNFIHAYQKVRPLSGIEKRFLNKAIVYAVASHIFLDYYKYRKNIIPLSYLRFLHREFYPFIAQNGLK